MTSKPMHFFLKDTFHVCYIRRTSVTESGLTVSIETLPGETVLFFHMDSDEGREKLNMVGEGIKVCDYLVFYMKDSENKETVCLLELKGRKLDDAIKQVLSTHEHVKALAREKIGREHIQHTAWKACICLHGQAPRSGKRLEEQLKRKFGKGNVCIKHGKNYKLGEFLRENTI